MIELRNIAYRAGQFVLRDIQMSVPVGQYAVLMGRTGQGKTTLLEILCGLRRVERGSVWIGGRDVTAWRPTERGIGFVPQDLALFPHLDVRGNLEFGLRVRRWGRAETARRVDEVADWLQVRDLLGRATADLSGGERQRVALGRAIAFRPRVLLLDEPLSALDVPSRESIRDILRGLPAATGATVVHVTHDRDEAMALADQLYTLADGQITTAPVAREGSER